MRPVRVSSALVLKIRQFLSVSISGGLGTDCLLSDRRPSDQSRINTQLNHV